MYLQLLTNNNALQYADMIPEAFLHRSELLGAVCLDDEDTPIGIAITEPIQDTLNIQWLYVLPEYRRTGAGSLMLQGIAEMAEAADLEMVDVYYHSMFSDNDGKTLEEKYPELPERELYKIRDEMHENEGIDYFLLENGFVVMRENPIKSFLLSDVISSDYVAKRNKDKDKKQLKEYVCVPFDEITPADEEYVTARIKDSGYPDYTPYCRRDLSFICRKDNSPVGCILITDDPDERTLMVMLILNFSSDPLCAAKLIVIAGEKVLQLFPPEYRVSFVGVNDSILKLVDTFLDNMDRLKTVGLTTHAVFEVNA